MSRFFAAILAALFLGVGGVPLALGQPVTVTPDRTPAVYAVGETVRWSVRWTGTAAPPVTHYSLKTGGRTLVEEGDLSFTNNTAEVSWPFTASGTVLVEVRWQPASDANRAWGGAVAAPGEIQPAADEPADFDAFWTAKLAELAAVPANPVLQSVASGRAGVDYWKVTMDNIRGTHVQGQIARPQSGEKFPALLIVQWAGVYGLDNGWVTGYAADGWLALNLNAHDLPIDETAAFYQAQSSGPLANYWMIGNEDRDTSYYLRMYLSCYRAVDYLKSRADWDGRTIVVTGGSQGGQQALMTAGLHPDVTAVVTAVPAACDMLAPAIGRAAGFPHWYDQTWGGRDPLRVREASRYYDPVNFAARIRCPALIALGLFDTLSPPSSIFAAVNRMRSPREVLIMDSGHQNENGSHDPYNQRAYSVWFPTLRTGGQVEIPGFPQVTATHMTGEGGSSGIALFELYEGAGSDSRLVNVSARADIGTGENFMIPGFAITGNGAKTVLIRAVGPSLSNHGVTGWLANPMLTICQGTTPILSNDDWGQAPDVTALVAASDAVRAFPLNVGSTDWSPESAGRVALESGHERERTSPGT